MPHYQRYILTDERKLSLEILLEGLQEANPGWTLADRVVGPPETAELRQGDESYARLELNLSHEDVFKEEVTELVEIAENVPGPKQGTVLQTLAKAKAVLAVEVLWRDREREDTLAALEPVWRWLFHHRRGLKHEDGEGFGDETGLILEVR